MAAFEFTPEITKDFYDQLARKITQRGETDAGRARSEALSRGLGGDPYEASAVGLARQGTSNELAGLDANLNFDVAGLKRDERLGKEKRGYQVEDRDFGAAEAEKERAFREKMSRLVYDQSRDMEALQNRRAYQSAIWSAGAGLAGKAIGAGLF